MQYYKISELADKHNLDKVRLSRLIRNMPKFIDGIKKVLTTTGHVHHYLIPESEVPKLQFLKKKK